MKPSDSHSTPRNWNLDYLLRQYDFSGHTIVISGGTGVLGSVMARALLGFGANVVVLDRDHDRARHSTAQPRHVYCDVLRADSVAEAANAIAEEYGRVDAIINAAGGNRAAATTDRDRSFFDLSDEALRHVLDLNVLGTLRCCQAFGRLVAETGAGSIVNISSMAAFRPLTKVGAYSAAKAAVSNFTRWLAVYMAQEYSAQIRVNALAPGFFITEQNRYLLTDADTGQLTARGESIIEHTPMGRFGEPDDLIGVLLWLLSPLSAFVTGTIIPVDGGFSAFSGV